MSGPLDPVPPATPDLHGKVAVVTGGGKGVGAAISRELARHGAHVVVNYFHSPEAAEATVAAVRRAGGHAQALRASVAKREQVTAMFGAIAEEHGGVDILVNNAARGVFARYDDLTDTEWQRALDTNLHGARWCALAAAPLMAARGGGAIVNVSSIGAGLAMDNYLLVGVCKAALEAMTRYLAADLGPQGIRVNTASAGLLDNPTAALFPGADDLRSTCRAASPLGRLGTEEDLARVVAFLASPQARWISGQCLLADGGLSVGRAMLTPRPGPLAGASGPPGASGTPTASGGPDTPGVREVLGASGTPTASEGPDTPGVREVLGSSDTPGAREVLDVRETLGVPDTPGVSRVPDAVASDGGTAPLGAPSAAAAEDRTVAVVGMGLVAPGVDDPDMLWQRLVEGVPQFGEPGDRFEQAHFWSPEAAPDRTYSRVAGYVRPAPPGREDFLTAWTHTALAQCGAGELAAVAGIRAACFVGAWSEGSQHVEESLLVEAAAEGIAAHWPATADEDLRERLRALLTARYPHAGRVAEHLPLAAVRRAVARLLPARTPVRVVDTACSSSLYAIDLGARAVLDGECELALCGGVFSLGPRYSVLFSQLRGLSRSGAVRALDGRADGVLFSDGAGFVALKRLDRARADGDRILGVLAGFGAASDGRGRAVHAPHHTGQERALARARAVSGVAAERIDWVVAHATGTPVGDAVERGVVARGLPHAWCTSNKSVIGHTGWTAGVASVVHALQALAHSVIPPQAPYSAPADEPAPRVPTGPVPWPRPAGRPRTVGVSSFGFGGTNAHLLLQDAPRPGEAAPASLPEPAADDPVVAVAWSAHLPGAPDAREVARRLGAGLPPAGARSFGPGRPAPAFADVRMPARTVEAVDPAQLMALQVTGGLTGPGGAPWWDGLQETCGVFAAHTGVPSRSPDVTLRCYATSLTETVRRHATARAGAAEGTAPAGLDPEALEEATAALLAAVRARPAPGEDTLAGLMPNVIPARVAALHDLHGPTMTLDTGTTSGRTALRAAAAHLRRGELDLALVIGVNGAGAPLLARVHGLDASTSPAEGAFALLLTRASVAAARGWTSLGELPSLLAVLPDESAPRTGWSYHGADDLVDVLRHVVVTTSPTDAGTRREADVSHTPVPPSPLTRRHTLSWRRSDTTLAHPSPPLPARTLVVADIRHADALRPLVRAGGHSRLLALDGTRDPQEAVDSLLAENPKGFAHLRIVADLRSPHGDAWPAPPSAGVLRVQEAAFWAVRQSRDRLVAGGSCAVAVMAPFADGHPHPHAHLFTGFVKSLAWELTGCTVRAVVGDTASAHDALTVLEDELARPADGLPVVHHRGGGRYVQRLAEDAPPPSGDALPLAPGAVVVATGGARGITAACLVALARQVPLRVHLVGSGRPGDVPGALLDTPDAALPAARARHISAERGRAPGRPVREISADFDRLLHARESALTLRRLRELCGEDRVHFHTCDLTDPKAVDGVADSVRAREGRVDLLVNGAGLHHPGDITRKTLPGMRRVRDVKLYGYHHLRAAFTGALAPRLWCNFGSVTGVAGLPGESDYSPANDFLSGAAQAGPPGEYTIAWTIWDETGLGSGAVVQSYTARTARLSRMTTAEGVGHFLAELRRRPRCEDRLVTFVGEAEHHSFDLLFPGLRTPHARPRTRTATGSGDAPRRTRPDAGDGAPPATPGPPGLLPPPVERRRDGASWHLALDVGAHRFLLDHLVDGRPTVPGVLLADIAVQAARTLAPGRPVRSVDDLAFSAWVRARTDGAPARFRVEARRTEGRGADSGTACVVAVTIRSDTTAPDGRILSRDREHFRATVRLGDPPLAPASLSLPAGPRRPVDDPYYSPASPVRLTGAFRATDACHTTGLGTTARWRPDPGLLAGLPLLGTPCTLLDSLARTPALQPDPDGRHPVPVPRSIERITLYEPGDDRALLASHPGGLLLHHAPATGTSTATDGHGRVVARITGMRGTTLAHLPAAAARGRSAPPPDTPTAP
ncbi:SDR family oxidoreductase [Streptomyces sp. NPDC058052]|uniref:SDR family oxidoreductase n=1 Tax=Streptomyces sp. NPDC058052 TaxID=3346316 RepID=UPI0036EDE581